MKCFLPTLLAAAVVLALPQFADGQRKGRSSRRSSGGSVRVKGYYRKDGTYVAPHYRTRPNRSIYDNWSYRGNVNPFTGKVGTQTYRYGVWFEKNSPSKTYNTPFRGVMADYSSTGLVISGTEGSSIGKGWRVSGFRLSPTAPFSTVSAWDDLCLAVFNSDATKIWLKGRKPDGKDFTEQLEVLGADSYFGGDDDESDEARSLLGDASIIAGATRSVEDKPARVLGATKESNLAAGWEIQGIRTSSQSEFTKVGSWSEIRNFVEQQTSPEVVVRGVDLRGNPFVMGVRLSITKSSASRLTKNPPYDELTNETGIFVGTDSHKGAEECYIYRATKDSNLVPGSTITGIRRIGEATFTKVSTWNDVAAYLATYQGKQVEVVGTTLTGEKFVTLVRVRG